LAGDKVVRAAAAHLSRLADHAVVRAEAQASLFFPPMSRTTRATLALHKAGIEFTVHEYDYDPDAPRIGLQAAEALGVAPDAVLKTLMAEVDGKPICVVIPSDREVGMKALARAFDAKTARMMRPADAERITGYVVGGVSPFGQKRRVPAVVEETALLHDLVFINAGRRGLQVRLDPEDAVAVLHAKVAALAV
jgi:Cys-tRNA(Pro)/Cys-tRNA(Cys) deacylase